jgi:hypothetical protein
MGVIVTFFDLSKLSSSPFRKSSIDKIIVIQETHVNLIDTMAPSRPWTEAQDVLSSFCIFESKLMIRLHYSELL